MLNIKVGVTCKTEWTVTDSMLACNVGSGTARVLATPMLAALMENSALHCVDEFCEDGETTVGIELSISHTSATPEGMKVWAIAEITKVEGRVITYKISAFDECGEIGIAAHKRCVVYGEKFQAKADQKKK